VVAYLGQLDEAHRMGVHQAAAGTAGAHQKRLFDDTRPTWVEVDVKRVRVENRRAFGGPWLGLELIDALGLKEFLARTMPRGEEEVPVGTRKSMLKQFERELLAGAWQAVREGLEVKRCSSPDGQETFVLCRSRDRREKEKAMHERFEKRIEEGLRRIEAGCRKQHRKRSQIGIDGDGGGFRNKILYHGNNFCRKPPPSPSRPVNGYAAPEAAGGGATPRTVVGPEQPCRRTISDRGTDGRRWPGKSDVEKGRAMAGLGRAERGLLLAAEQCRRLERGGTIELVDVVLPTRRGTEIRRRCITEPTDHQALLAGLKMNIPKTPLTDGA
jgi:hypothetical protein